MWFGTRKGLNKYDGYEFTSYQELKGSISHSHITCMTEDGDWRLWVRTRKG